MDEYDEMYGIEDDYDQQFADELEVLAEMDDDEPTGTVLESVTLWRCSIMSYTLYLVVSVTVVCIGSTSCVFTLTIAIVLVLNCYNASRGLGGRVHLSICNVTIVHHLVEDNQLMHILYCMHTK